MLNSYIYIISNKPNGVLYTGVTSDLKKRIWQHKQGNIEGFSKKYNLKKLVWFEVHDDISEAIKREKQLKKWNRDWKLKLIEEVNPNWNDLFKTL